MIWAEGELMLQVPPGLIASSLTRAIGGDAGKALREIQREILYRPRVEARAAVTAADGTVTAARPPE